jgi:hypothetical protein
LETITSGKNKFSIERKFPCQMYYLIWTQITKIESRYNKTSGEEFFLIRNVSDSIERFLLEKNTLVSIMNISFAVSPRYITSFM